MLVGSGPDPSSVGASLKARSHSSLHLGAGHPLAGERMHTMCTVSLPCTNHAPGASSAATESAAVESLSPDADSLELELLSSDSATGFGAAGFASVDGEPGIAGGGMESTSCYACECSPQPPVFHPGESH